MIRIHFTYRHVDKPWGGANTFVRALSKALLESKDFQQTTNFDEPCDLLFMNQIGAGPGSNFREWQLSFIRNRIFGSVLNENGMRPALVVRAVNLMRNVDVDCGIRTWLLGYIQDRKIIALLNMADLVIFQSNYQKQLFFDAGYRGQRSIVIYNGAENDFWEETPRYIDNDSRLKLIALSFSTRRIKRHDLIAQFSTLPNVEVTYIGNWPTDISPNNVKLCGVLNHVQIKQIMREHHYLLHPATRDACPNVILEALNLGLPVIFNPQPGGSAELVQDAGIPLNEDDLASTVIVARSELNYLRSRALHQRHKYRLDDAVQQYANAFRQLLQTSRV